MSWESRYNNLPSQKVYGFLLGKLVNIGMLLLAATFVVYILGWLDPLIPLDQIATTWSLPLEKFIEKTGAPTGWGWATLLYKGDYLNLLPIAFLSSVSVLCYAVILRHHVAEKNKGLALIVITEIGLILLASSNLLGGKGH